MTETISALQNLLESLFRIQSSAWFAEEGKWRASSQALETYKLVSAMWDPIDLKNVKHEFNKSELDLDFSNRVLYLPPMKKDANFVPVSITILQIERNPKHCKIQSHVSLS